MSLVDWVGPFLLLLGILVVVHELGHFAVAKWFDVKVERFSVGFGPALVRRTVGETEYVLAWLPLGGYVKMAGESPDDELPAEDRMRGFNAQSPARRIAIALAGPGMNLVLSVLVIAGVYMTGWPTPTSLVGKVLADSPAAASGLQPRDRIVAIDGVEIWRWQEFFDAVRASGGEPLTLTVERDDERLTLTLTPGPAPGGRGLWSGAQPNTPAAILAIADSDSAAARAGLRTGDRVTELAGVEIRDWYDFERALQGRSGPLELAIARELDDEEEVARLTVPEIPEGAWTLERLGTRPVAFEVLQLTPGKPAERAGFEVGDLALLVNGEPATSFEEFATDVREGGGAPLAVVVVRDGRHVALEVTPAPETVQIAGEPVQIHRIGLAGQPPAGSFGEMRDDVVRNPLRALGLGASRTATLFAFIIDGVGKLITREVSIDNLAGPIGIGQLAAQSFAKEGWFEFLWMMCVISVNLAILNLLPIPILDGGHILFALTESVRGRAVGMRAREIAQTIGISLVLLLMGFAFWNDISRNWASIVDFFKGLV